MWRHDFQLSDAITLEPIQTTPKSASLMGPGVVRIIWQPLCSRLKFEILAGLKLPHPAENFLANRSSKRRQRIVVEASAWLE